MHTKFGDNMINYYKQSKKAFKKYIIENQYTTREEWDEYAHKNCLFSAFALECHKNVYNFEDLKSKMKRSIFV